jgi:hypothetical protein
MALKHSNFKFYLSFQMLVGALALFLLAKEDLPSLPSPALLGLTGAGLGLAYLVLVSAWTLQKCRDRNFSRWVAPLSGALAGLILGVGLEFIFFQGSAHEGAGVNGCLAVGAVVSVALFSKSLLETHWESRGRSGRMRTWI